MRPFGLRGKEGRGGGKAETIKSRTYCQVRMQRLQVLFMCGPPPPMIPPCLRHRAIPGALSVTLFPFMMLQAVTFKIMLKSVGVVKRVMALQAVHVAGQDRDFSVVVYAVSEPIMDALVPFRGES